MDWTTLAAAILGSTAAAAIVNLISERLRRRDAVSDRKENVKQQIDDLRSDTNSQFEEFRSDTKSQFEMVDGRFKEIDGKIVGVAQDTKSVAMLSKAQAYDRIRHLGLSYIKAGEVAQDELRNLIEMHEAYHELGGNGFLDKLMDEVNKLRLKP